MRVKTGFSNTLVLRRVSKPLYSATARRNSISLQRSNVDGYGRPAAPRRTVGSRRTVSATFTTSTEGWTACLIARCVTGILFVLRSDSPWQMLSQELDCGSGMTCWRRLRDWQDGSGVQPAKNVSMVQLQKRRSTRYNKRLSQQRSRAWPYLRALASARTRSSFRWASAAWARSIAPATPGSNGTWRSRSCRRKQPMILRPWRVSDERHKQSPPCSTRTSSRSMTSASTARRRSRLWSCSKAKLFAPASATPRFRGGGPSQSEWKSPRA